MKTIDYSWYVWEELQKMQNNIIKILIGKQNRREMEDENKMKIIYHSRQNLLVNDSLRRVGVIPTSADIFSNFSEYALKSSPDGSPKFFATQKTFLNANIKLNKQNETN